jgi:glycosyltransferase involved in cell wall biosynthesis
MRVVIINDFSTPFGGGASSLACLLAQQLERRQIPVTFFSGDKLSDTKPCRDTIGVGGEALVRKGKADAFVTGLYDRGAYRALRTLIETSDTPDTVYHVHGISQTLSPSVLHALAKVRARTILHAHDFFLPCPNGGFANYQTSTICQKTPLSMSCLTTQCDKRNAAQKAWRVVRQSIRERVFPIRGAAARIITIHEGMRPFFARAGIRQELLQTIRNPVEPVFTPETPPSPWKNKNFFFIGRIEPEKGYDLAAEAARRAGVLMQFIGEGVGRPVLEQQYPEAVCHGWKDRDGIRKLLASARAVVVASRLPEPFGLVAIEAAAGGIPVIAPRSALLAPELERIGCGAAFKDNDAVSLAQLMSEFAGNDEAIRQMSVNGLQHAMSLANSTDSWTDALLKTYHSVLAAQAETVWEPGDRQAVDWAHRPEVGTATTSYSVAGMAEGQLHLYPRNVSLNRGS